MAPGPLTPSVNISATFLPTFPIYFDSSPPPLHYFSEDLWFSHSHIACMVCCLDMCFTYIILIHSGRIFCLSMPKSDKEIQILIRSKKICSVQKYLFEGQHVVFKGEHKTTQIKCLKGVTVGDCVANKSDKLALNVSAFAGNHREGHIYYGIDDYYLKKLRRLGMWAGIDHLVRELTNHCYLSINYALKDAIKRRPSKDHVATTSKLGA